MPWSSSPKLDRDELLAHYLARGAEPWNVSLEAAWLDYELRAWVQPRLPRRRPVKVANIGIGTGLWDDWLGYEIGGAITSVDRDPQICRVFAIRQHLECHPHPAIVRCGDAASGLLGHAQFDVITIVGSTLAETGDRTRLESAALAALVPGGVLLIAEVGEGDPPGSEVKARGSLWIAFAARCALAGARGSSLR